MHSGIIQCLFLDGTCLIARTIYIYIYIYTYIYIYINNHRISSGRYKNTENTDTVKNNN